jgi:hypothetical protein
VLVGEQEFDGFEPCITSELEPFEERNFGKEHGNVRGESRHFVPSLRGVRNMILDCKMNRVNPLLPG